jgi:hypothetical protein
MADLFHVTTSQVVDDIFRDGLLSSADQRVFAMTDMDEDDMDGPTQEPPEVTAERRMEELISDARRAADVPSEWPVHELGVFSWPTHAAAIRSSKGMYGASSPIVAVDSTLLPDETILLTAPTGPLNVVFSSFYYVYTDRASYTPEDEERMYREVVEWWGEVQVYEGQALSDHEVWCGTDIPPTAIEWIQDTANDRRLYEPPSDPQQTRFVDLFD